VGGSARVHERWQDAGPRKTHTNGGGGGGCWRVSQLNPRLIRSCWRVFQGQPVGEIDAKESCRNTHHTYTPSIEPHFSTPLYFLLLHAHAQRVQVPHQLGINRNLGRQRAGWPIGVAKKKNACTAGRARDGESITTIMERASQQAAQREHTHTPPRRCCMLSSCREPDNRKII